VDFEKYLHDPVALGIAGGVLLIIVIVVFVLSRRDKGPKGRVVDDTKARARAMVRDSLRTFRDEVKRAADAAAPVFRNIEKDSEHKDAVGHWRKSLKHRINVRTPNFNALKGTAKMLGYDSQGLIDLDAAWKKTGKQVADYNAGLHDGSKIPITWAKEFEKEFQKIVILVNMCLTKYGN
jgi:hypothetical protein